MTLINTDCCASFVHLTKTENAETLFAAVDKDAKEIIMAIVKGAETIAFENNLSVDAMKTVISTNVITATAMYHLFRIQKESDDLEKDG